MVGKSINGIIPEVHRTVRGDILCTFFRLNRVSDSVTEVCMGGCVNPKGSIPKLIINKMMKKQAVKLAELRKKLP